MRSTSIKKFASTISLALALAQPQSSLAIPGDTALTAPSGDESAGVVNPGLNLTPSGSAINPASLSPKTLQGAASTSQVEPKFYGPDDDTNLDTKFGAIHIAKGSLVLVITCDVSISVYDLHDGRPHAVSVESEGHQFVLSPTKHITLARPLCNNFAAANRLPFVIYTNTKSEQINDQILSYRGDFDIASLIMRYAPFKELIASKDQKTRRIAENVLKNAAIMSQMTSISRYNRPPTVISPATIPK